MKRGTVICMLLIVLISLIQANSNITGQTVTGEIITGEATTQQLDMNIYAQLVLPYIVITSPKNQTYLINESILFNYTAHNYERIWYNLDNSENISINSSIYLEISEGIHTLYV